MFRCFIKIFGLPHEITGLREVEVELKNGANLGDVIAALRLKIPALEGSVIYTGEDRITEYYAFNINGRFYFDDRELQIREDDRIALLALATGG